MGLLCISAVLAADAPGSNTPPLMPWPANISVQPGSIAITNDFSVGVSGAGAKDPRVAIAVDRIWSRLAKQTGQFIRPHLLPASEAATLTVIVEERDHKPPQRLGDDESYSLEAADGRVRISATYPLGALRGIETFLQAVQQNKSEGGQPSAPGFSIANVRIQDQPRFPWRGLSLDVSRHFIPADEVKREIDGLAAVKLNVLHWHLSDDQGFRVESKRYPRLQQYGSNEQYYTQAEIRDVVQYARDRGVRVVPEFDMPGHATSWMPAYPMLAARTSGQFQIAPGFGILADIMDPTKESTYKFLDNFVGEMVKLFPDEYFHIGGDEVAPRQWNENPRIQAFMKKHHIVDAKELQVYFNQRLLKIVTKHGKRMEGWDEILQPNLPKTILIQSWRGQESLWQAAREGYKGILSAGYYLDLMRPAEYHYAIDPLVLPEERKAQLQRQNKPIPESLTSEEAKNVLGGEAAMWEELCDAENLDSRLWPRLAAIAERFWSPQSVTDVNSMYARLVPTNYWLEWLGLTQRSGLASMRQRLAGSMDHGPLDRFSSILEPVKGYGRHAGKYQTTTPLNRLVDSIAPESQAAREFRDAVDAYLAKPAEQRNSEELREHLTRWAEDARTVRLMFATNSVLTENLPAADAVERLCDAGLQALQTLDTGVSSTNARDAAWKAQTSQAVKDASSQKADMLIQIAPGVQKLVDAVQVGPTPTSGVGHLVQPHLRPAASGGS
ncbi:MAG: family 20 glycosylhydrolase [Acidobacteriaceae bacterium]|nr:family 20 glycosylhydrolase [Acidobacteriaceae bacterium]